MRNINRILFLLFITLLFANCKKKDTQGPLMVFKGPSSVILNLGDEFILPQVEIMDNRDCRAADRLQIINPVDMDRYGDYVVEYIVEDEAGNSSKLEYNVRVILQKEDYYSLEYVGVDSCLTSNYTYPAVIQNCDCEENIVHLFNLGNFGISTRFNLQLGGDFNHEVSIDQEIGDVQFYADGMMDPTAGFIELSFSASVAGAETDSCNTLLTNNL